MRRARFLISFLFLSISLVSLAQPKLPLKWTYTVKKVSECEFELQFKADAEKGFHLYSQKPTDDGPLPTEFIFDKSTDFKLVGKTIEPKAIERAEPVFNNAVIRYFEGTATFVQKIKSLTDKSFKVKGAINGMTCNESQCFPFSPPFDFEFEIASPKPCPETGKLDVKTNPAPGGNSCDTAAIVKSYLAGHKPANNTLDSIHSKTKTAGIADSGKGNDKDASPVQGSGDKKAWYVIFILGFIGGFAALLTPCVFPMIPMTVSFFTKRSKTKAKGVSNALIYSASIIVLYVSLGLGVTAIFGDDALNRLSTNVWLNLFFFLLLVVFAISFLGAFEITLPSSFVNRIDSASDRGGLIGIFFMALTLAVVSFSCTSAIIGALLAEAASIGGYGPFWGMLGFAIALSLPFGLFAAFPGWMNSLPKSGGWLNTVKVFLGFLELAFAFKFASKADLVVQAHVLNREVFLVIWVAVFGSLGAYLMGWFKLPHDSELKHLSVGRLLLAMFVFCFTIYLIPGLWGAPLKLISGFPPPQFYSESPQGFGGASGGGSVSGVKTGLPEHAHLGSNNIIAFDDLKFATEYARSVNKPLMIDFTGWACENCRKMEEQVWSDPEVKKRLNDKFVLVSLYVDDKTELPLDEQKEVEWNGKRTLRTVGNKWSYLQSTKYKALALPQYRIISADGDRLSDSTSYDPDIQKYLRWLDKGLEAFHSAKGK
jgi:thiol:disulfide interchange protein DsbD